MRFRRSDRGVDTELAHASSTAGMCGGQAIDLAAVGTTPTIAELERMHRMKTGALLKAAVLMGALSGRASLLTEHTRGARQYGEAIGLAFQIVDDLLDVEASTAELGKTAGKDAEQRKPTYVAARRPSGPRWSLRLRAQALQAIEESEAARSGCENWPTLSFAGKADLSYGTSQCDQLALRPARARALAIAAAGGRIARVRSGVGVQDRRPLSSNLGTVELTIALHYVFDTPEDRIVWDVGHQTYPHKILTGRRDHMAQLRQHGGMSGFPRRSESEYDTFGTAHSSTSVSAAFGMAVAARNQGSSRHAVAVIGDGAMSAGMAFEALNNAGVTDNVRLLVVLNDNDMSISPAVGGLNRYLARLMSGKFYAAAKQAGKQV